MIYLTNILAFGLIQFWVLFGFLTLKQINYSYWDLIKDGGLFVFASSLAITTFLHHRKIFFRIKKKQPFMIETYWSYFSVSLVMLLCLIGFISAIEINSSRNSFEIVIAYPQNIAQISSAIISIGYGFVVEKRLELAIK
jgi:hypothetical protein